MRAQIPYPTLTDANIQLFRILVRIQNRDLRRVVRARKIRFSEFHLGRAERLWHGVSESRVRPSARNSGTTSKTDDLLVLP